MINKLIPALFLTAALAATAVAQPPAYDCTAEGHHRDFDFWQGNWTVHDGKGNLAGSNRITRVQKNCALEEQWASATGGTGQSLNYYHPGRGKWHQLWLDAGASIIDISGGLEQGAMVLTGNIYYLQQGTQKDFRGSWTPLADGRVRQFFEEQDESGKWQVWFDGYYSRLEED